MVPLALRRVLLGSRPSITRNLGNLLLCVGAVSESVEVFISFAVDGSGSASGVSFGVGGEHGGDVSLCPDMLIYVWWWHLAVCTPRLSFKILWLETNFAKNAEVRTNTKSHSSTHGYSTPKAPQRGSLFLWYTANQATFRTPTLTPHGDAFLHHLWSGVTQYSAYELTLGKRKVRDQGRGGHTSHLDILGIWPFKACSLSFLGSGQQSAVHRPKMHSSPPTWQARDSASQDSGYPHDKWHRTLTHAFRVIGPWDVQSGL